MLLCCHWQEFYETTLGALERAKNDRLWFKTQLKLASLWFKKAEYGRLTRILKDLHKWGDDCILPEDCDSCIRVSWRCVERVLDALNVWDVCGRLAVHHVNMLGQDSVGVHHVTR